MTTGDRDVNAGHRPCGGCGKWPEPFYILEGDSGRGRNVSFGHSDSMAEAEADLPRARSEFPDLIRWSITKMTPATITEVVSEFETPNGDES